jgi:hypothetical protein
MTDTVRFRKGDQSGLPMKRRHVLGERLTRVFIRQAEVGAAKTMLDARPNSSNWPRCAWSRVLQPFKKYALVFSCTIRDVLIRSSSHHSKEECWLSSRTSSNGWVI